MIQEASPPASIVRPLAELDAAGGCTIPDGFTEGLLCGRKYISVGGDCVAVGGTGNSRRPHNPQMDLRTSYFAAGNASQLEGIVWPPAELE